MKNSIKKTGRFTRLAKLQIRLFFLSAFLCFSLLVQSQDFNNYQPLQSLGKVPEKFLVSATDKYNEELNKISSKEKARYRRAKQQFFLESSFHIDELILSGKVLFNDPVGIYVNKVVDEILKNDPDLRKKVQVYIIKSNEVNAFTMANTGMIFVTLGMLAHVENEAELAMILCHEITHYVNQHAINKVIENTDISYGKGQYRKTAREDKFLARTNFSKKEESEADLVGIDRYLKTDYDPLVFNGEFDVMQYSHLPYTEVPFQKNFFETTNLKFPADYFLPKVLEISASETNDSLQTHPAVPLRRAAIQERLKGMVFSGKKRYIIGQDAFLKAQKLSRYEMCNIYIHNRDYEPAIYHCYLLLQDDPQNKFLYKTIGKALYGLSKYANADRYNEAHTNYVEIQGSSQQVYHLFEKMSPAELCAFSIGYLYNLEKKYPEDHEIEALTEDLLSELPQYFNDKTYFSTAQRPANFDQANKTDSIAKKDKINKNSGDADDDEGSTPKKKTSKYKKSIKSTEKSKEEDVDEDADGNIIKKNEYIKYVFVDQLTHPDFVSKLEKVIKDYNDQLIQDSIMETPEYKKQQRKRSNQKAKKEVETGYDKIVIVNPLYYKIDASKKTPVKFVASENAQKDFNNKIKENASLAGLKFELVDKKDLNADAVDRFNDQAILNDYIEEQSDLDDMHFVNYKTESIENLTKKYGTAYFNWTGIISYREHNNYQKVYLNTCLLCGSIFVLPVLPFALYNEFRTHYNTYVYSLVYNLKTGKVEHDYYEKLNYKDRTDVLNSVLYNIYLHYKKRNN